MADELYGDVTGQPTPLTPDVAEQQQDDQAQQALMPSASAQPEPPANSPPPEPQQSVIGNSGQQKPLSWDEVTSKPEFKSLPDAQQELARQQYFKQVVAPQVPSQYLEEAKKQFDSSTGQATGVAGQLGHQLGLTARYLLEGPAMGVAALGDAVNLPINAVTGSKLGMPTDYVSEAFDKMGFAKPQNQNERNIQVPSEIVSGLMTPELGKAAKDLGTNIASTITNPDPNAAKSGLLNFGMGAPPTTAGDTLDLKNPPLTAEQGKDMAKALYKKADDEGGVAGSKSVVDTWLDNIKKEIPEEGSLVKNARGEGGKDSETAKLISNLEQNRGQMASYSSLDELDKFLGNEAHAAFRSGDNTTGANIAKINDLLLHAVNNAPEGTLPGAKYGELARQAFTQQLKLRQLEAMQQFAENTKNPATSIQAQSRQLLKRENTRKGSAWSPDELALVDKAAKTGKLTDLLQTYGNRLSMFFGHGLMGHAANALGSGVARSAATKIQTGKLSNVSQAVSDKIPSPYDTKGLIPRIQSGQTVSDDELAASMAGGN